MSANQGRLNVMEVVVNKSTKRGRNLEYVDQESRLSSSKENVDRTEKIIWCSWPSLNLAWQNRREGDGVRTPAKLK